MNTPAHAKELRHQAATLHTDLINRRTTLSIVEARDLDTRMRRALAEAAAIEAELSAMVAQ